MRQILFEIPTPWFNIPVYGYGMMLFITFLVCTWLASRRARGEGIAPQHIQDLAIWVFVGGIAGARIVFMIQYGVPFWDFYKIWQGGLVFYGSAIGGVAGYGLAYYFIIRKHGLSSWQLADIVAPSVAIGLCLGRVGCLLNGCCYGNVACPHCLALHFPLSAPARSQLVDNGLQTAGGFTIAEHRTDQDPRTIIETVADGSPAQRSGLQPGDLVVAIGDATNERRPNNYFVEVTGSELTINQLGSDLELQPAYLDVKREDGNKVAQFEFDQLETMKGAVNTARKAAFVPRTYDALWSQLTYHWPRGKVDLALTVKHKDGTEEELPPFEPVTLGLHPTQVYESVSTFLLFLLATAFYPFRPRQGMVFVLVILCYSVHRFIDEALRNDTKPPIDWLAPLTLSQILSLIFFIVGIGLAIYLWKRPDLKPPAMEGEPLQPTPELAKG